MNIQITDDYIMTSDAHNFILNEVATAKEGKDKGKRRLRPVAFYSRVEDLVQGIIDRHMSKYHQDDEGVHPRMPSFSK